MPRKRAPAAPGRAPRRRPRPGGLAELLHALTEHGSDAVALLDDGGAIASLSPAAARLFGYPVEELVGAQALSFVHPEDAPRAHELFARLLEQPATPLTAALRCRHRDGSYRRVEAVGVNRLDEPAVGAIVVHYRDEQQKALAADELRTSQHLKAVVDSALDAVVTMDGSGVIRDWGGRAEAVFGWSAAEAVGRPLAETIIPPHQREAHRRGLARFLETGEGPLLGRRIEITALRRDGREFPVELTVTPVRLADRWLFSAFVRDITARRQAEEALRAANERYRSLVEGVRDVIFALSPGGEVVQLNPAFEAITGLPPGDWIGQPFEALVHPDDVPIVGELFGRALRGEPRPTNQFRIRTRTGGYRVGEFSVSAQLREGRLVGLLGIGRDVTERLGLEQQLRQAQKLEAVGRLAGGIAHDFNNILTAITGHAELLLQDLGTSDPRREDVTEIRRSAERAAALTGQLLAFSRQQVLQPKVLDLNALVADMDKLLRRLIGEDIELAATLEPGLWHVRADPGQLEQVIANLAVNARDAMPQGGRLMLQTRNVELDASYAMQHGPVQPGAYVLLAVSDTGIGMDEETQAHIFEPFFTTKPRGQGTGLGLSTVYGIVKQSGGYIWVYSEPGLGATFKIYLPRADAPTEPAAPARRAAAPGGSETVLLAEDEAAVRNVARQVLERHGYEVLVASSGREALAIAAQRGARIDLLITDVVMPGMSGRDLAERLAAERPGVRVLYISGYTDDAIVRHGMLEPGLAYLEKPFAPDALAQKVREVLDAKEQDP